MMGVLEVMLAILGFYVLYCITNGYKLIPGDYGIVSLMIIAAYLLLSTVISSVMVVAIGGTLIFKKKKLSRNIAIFVLLISLALLVLNFLIYKSF